MFAQFVSWKCANTRRGVIYRLNYCNNQVEVMFDDCLRSSIGAYIEYSMMIGNWAFAILLDFSFSCSPA